MDTLIAKKYANAIILDKLTDNFFEKLNFISQAFYIDKFNLIINSNEISKDKKLNLILSFCDNVDDKFLNFLKLLANNSRLSYIPYIAQELKKQKDIMKNSYEGFIYTKEKIQEDKLKQIEEKISNKLNSKITLKNILNNEDGVKVSIDDLGYEIAFSVDILKNKISEYILKTI